MTSVVMDKLIAQVPCKATYPQLGPNTKMGDFQEALFVRSRQSTTYRDIVRYRDLREKKDFQDGEWTNVVGDDDFATMKNMSPAGKKMQAAIAKSVSDVEARRKAKERVARPDEDEKDEFYRWATHSIRELNNCSKTSTSQLNYARETMAAMFDKISAEKEVAFPEPNVERNLEWFGNHGDTTPQKPRKRARY